MAYKQNNPFSRKASSPFNQNGDEDTRGGYKKKKGYLYQPEIKSDEVRGEAVPVDTDGDGIPDVMRTTGTTNYNITGKREERGGPKAPDDEWRAFLETPEGKQWVIDQRDMQQRSETQNYDEPIIPEEPEETPDPYSVYIAQTRQRNPGSSAGFGGGYSDKRMVFEGPDAREDALKYTEDPVMPAGGYNAGFNATVLGTNRDERGLISQDHDTIYKRPNYIKPKEHSNTIIQNLIDEDPKKYGPQGRYPMELRTEDHIFYPPEMPTDLRTPEERKSRLPGIYGKTIN
tara:strand:- start:25 stop:885 length:861 start_codon:yes stop_codon:yes gene_type:complete